MKPEAIMKARARLVRAKEALEGLQKPAQPTRIEEYWSDLLVALNTVYTSLEQGAKTTPQSRQWFGKMKRERREDPLLAYVHQARNADEHGLDKIMLREEDNKRFEAEPGYWTGKKVKIKLSNGIEFDAPAAPPEAAALHVRVVRLALVPVTDSRFGTVFNPPTEHLGVPVRDGESPISVAELAYAYHARLVDQAERLAAASIA